MEKLYRWILGTLFLTLAFLLALPVSFAGLTGAGVFDGAEAFPSSRFGEPPAPPVYGDRQAGSPMQVELRESESTAQGRGLASLEKPAKPPLKINASSGVQEVALIASDLGFFPKTIFVTRDIPVRIYLTGASKKPLCMMMDSFNLRKQVRSQKVEELSFVPTQPGQYRFYCPINGAEGSLFVKELSSAAPMSRER